MSLSEELNASIDIDQGSMSAGDRALIQIGFTEPVFGFSNKNISVRSGIISTATSSDNKNWVVYFEADRYISDTRRESILSIKGITLMRTETTVHLLTTVH